MQSLPAPTARNARVDPGGLALVFGARRWTHADLEASVAASARRLAGLGLGPGGRLALLAGNRPEVVFLLHAAARLSVTLAPLNTRLAGPEIAALLARLRADVLVADAAGVAREGSADWAAGARVTLDDPAGAGWRAWESLPLAPGEVPPEVAAEHVHTVMFSSGTTGRAKGVLLPWRSHLLSALISAVPLRASARDRWLLNLPMFHVGGWSIAVRCSVLGATIELHPRFDGEATAGALAGGEVTLASLVAAGLDEALDHLPASGAGGALRAVLLGGGPAPPALLERAARAGVRVRTTYGLTEACSQVTTLDLADPSDPALSAGTPLPLTQVRVVDGERRGLPAGEEGEVEVRGPTLLSGYLDEPTGGEALEGGWLRTGDYGRLDSAGRLAILARRQDLIVSGGENLYPAEVEAALLALPGVAGAVVLAAPDKRWGQVPVALAVACPGASLDPAQLRAELATRLAGFKVPVRIEIVAGLPRTGAGKVDRAAAGRLLAEAEPDDA